MIKDVIDEEKISKLFFVNSITVIRLPLIIVFACNLINYFEINESLNGLNSIIISILIIVSDFIDGKLARRYSVSTEIGQKLDIYLDLLYILTAIGILKLYNKVDLFFIFVILYKFSEFILLSKVFRGNYKSIKGENYYYDLLGTLTSGLYYIIPSIVIVLLYFNVAYTNIIIKLLVVCSTILTALASVIKIKEIVILQIIRKL